MKLTNSEGIDFNIHLSGSYEDYSVEEIWFKDPDGVEWAFADNSCLLQGIISDDDIEQLAYDNAYEMEMDYYMTKADLLYDQMRDEGMGL